jgi:CIC family chloride channel protein
MGTAFAGIVRTPLTSVIMIFEMTRDYTIIVPLMISNLISFFISYKLQPTPIYEALALQDGVHLPGPDRADAGSRLRVSQAMRTPQVILRTDMDAVEAAREMVYSSGDALPIADARGFRGMLRNADLQKAALDKSAGKTLDEVLRGAPEFPHVHPDHSLGLALERMGAADVRVLPVVNRANVRELVGVVVLDDILSAYGVATPQQPTGDAR